MTTLREAFTKFIYAQDGEITEATIKWYKSHLATLIKKLGERDVEKITTDDLREWRYEQFHCPMRYSSHPIHPRVDGELSIYTKCGRIRAVKRLFNWLHTEGKIPNNPSASLKPPPKPQHREPKAIAEDEIVELLNVADHPRDIALLYVLVETGARVGGIAGLRLGDVSEDCRTLIVTEKGSATRPVYLTNEGAAALNAWLRVRPDVSNDMIFISRQRESGLTESGIYQVLKRLSQKAGVEKFNPHAFRHAFAREMLNAGASLETVADLMGHSSVTTTAENYAIWTQAEIKVKHHRFSSIRKARRERNDEGDIG